MQYSILDITMSIFMACVILILIINLLRSDFIHTQINKELYTYKPLNFKKIDSVKMYIMNILLIAITSIYFYLIYTDYEKFYKVKIDKNKDFELVKQSAKDYRFCLYDNSFIIGKNFIRNKNDKKEITSVMDIKYIQIESILYKCTREIFSNRTKDKIEYKVFQMSNGQSIELNLTRQYPSILQ